MPSLLQIQQEFIALLKSGDRDIENRVIEQGQLSNAQRIDIYSSGYRLRLRGVIDSDHEILGLYLGDDLFDQMVNGYIDSKPSKHPSLRFFADQLPEYLKSTSPFQEHAILAEIAGFERALLKAFDSADAQVVNEASLQQIAPEEWPAIRFDFHPSLIIYECQWNAVESWQKLKNKDTPHSPEQSQQTKRWVIWRSPQRLTEYKSLQQIEHKVLTSMLRGESFAQACEGVSNDLPAETLASSILAFIIDCLQKGWVTRIK